MDCPLTGIAALKKETILYLSDMLPAAIPRGTRVEDPEVVVLSNRIMSVPKLAYSNIYMFLSARILTDETHGLDAIVCRGCEELARTLLTIIQVNEHAITGGLASLLANYAAQTQHVEDTWVITIEPDTPHAWLRGWIKLEKLLAETQMQLKFLEDTKRQLALEITTTAKDCVNE